MTSRHTSRGSILGQIMDGPIMVKFTKYLDKQSQNSYKRDYDMVGDVPF